MKITIGDLLVHKGEPDNSNPYRGNSICGEERKSALKAFMDRKHTGCYTFWHAPACGGARRVIDPEEVAWETM
jgi:hypothetical protein